MNTIIIKAEPSEQFLKVAKRQKQANYNIKQTCIAALECNFYILVLLILT